MPARERAIGPEVSQRVAAEIKRRREELEMSMAGLSALMFASGDQMSAAVINLIENGISGTSATGGYCRRQRLITVDEAAAFAKILGPSVMRAMEE